MTRSETRSRPRRRHGKSSARTSRTPSPPLQAAGNAAKGLLDKLGPVGTGVALFGGTAIAAAIATITSDQTEQAARAQALKKLQTRYEQIQARIETMYSDKLDGRITQEFFDKQSAAWRSERDGLQRKI